MIGVDADTVQSLLTELTTQYWDDTRVRREPVRAWRMSAVERLHHGAGGISETVIFKVAEAPLHGEAWLLKYAAEHGVPTPRLLAVAERPRFAGMLLEDLGPAFREPTLADAAAAAVASHAVPGPSLNVPLLNAAGLADLPQQAMTSLSELVSSGRWDTNVLDVQDGLRVLLASAADLAYGAELPPFGLCHSEFHPTSLHIDADGQWRLLDWARAFTGPGLLDLISWQGTTTVPDTAKFRALLDAYVVAGGPPEVLADRGGLPVERWSILWHRIWIIDWYLFQALHGLNDPDTDAISQLVIRRHLTEALECLDTPSA
ncbi:phosphotransferase [Actinoallomurus sp. NBC_01490]|uniref:phosphotransferase n=1 Tax=Actinoallomurus sp. NBC_01490 TaxID=2903557 RepID=UPI002E2EA643|nr:phosphotransferase [Actinoallomurus sp. NBC_01490]